MVRLSVYIKHLLILLGLALSLCRAQQPPHLNVQPDRVRKASETEKEARRKNDSLLLAEAYYLYGKTYVFAGDYRTAQAYFLKSLRILETHGNSFELSRIYVRLCENEDKLGHSEQALRYAKLSFAVAQHLQPDKSGDKDKALIRAYGGLAHIHENRWSGPEKGKPSEFNQALFYYTKRNDLCYKLKDTLGIAEVSLELGTLLTKVKDPQAIPYLEKALALFTLNKKQGIRVNTMMHLASAYLTFGKPELAYQTLTTAEKLYVSEKLNEYEIRLGLETQFVRYFESSQKWSKAFARLRTLHELEKIKLLADQNGAISRLNMEYETEKREALLTIQKKEIALKTQNLRLHQRLAVAIFALFVIAAGMSFVFFRLYRKNRRISRRNADLVKEQNHRVKNNLQVVSSLLSLQSKRLSDETAKKAIEESRLRVQSMAIIHQRLYDGDKLAEVNLDEYIQELAEGVLDAYGYATVRTEFTIDKIPLPADKAVPLGLILNELITNSCKYAFPTTEHPKLSITCHKSGDKISLMVSDNGNGWADTYQNRSTGFNPAWTNSVSGGLVTEPLTVKRSSFGMQLIQSQVEQLYGTYQFRVDQEGPDKGLLFSMEFNV